MGSIFNMHQAMPCFASRSPTGYGASQCARIIEQLAQFYGLQGRILYLESGNLELLIEHAVGTVTVNSTVGFVSLKNSALRLR